MSMNTNKMDIINVSAGVYGGMKNKPNPVGAIKMIMKKDKKNKKDE